jgi:hypothetical protein
MKNEEKEGRKADAPFIIIILSWKSPDLKKASTYNPTKLYTDRQTFSILSLVYVRKWNYIAISAISTSSRTETVHLLLIPICFHRGE